MVYEEVIGGIEKIAPPELAPQWDNSGVQVYTGKENIQRILVCLEINGDIIEEAKKRSVDLIVSHHPLIFQGLKSINPYGYSSLSVEVHRVGEQMTSKYVMELIKADISAYSAHISFDRAPDGNNAYLSELLGLEDVYVPGSAEAEVTGLIGSWKEEKILEEVLKQLAEIPGVSLAEMRVVGNPKRPVNKVALCTGAGGDLLGYAISQGCDLFITGDVRFHEAQLAAGAGIALVDAGHFGTEKLFEGNFADQLREVLGNRVSVVETRTWGNPFANR